MSTLIYILVINRRFKMSITVNTAGGNTACLSTEFGTSPVGATCHLPLNKIVWGDDSVSHKVNETFPLPVQIMEITGEAIAFTGNMGASGSFPVINPILGSTGIEYLAVAGSTDGVTPIGVTGNITIENFPGGNTLNTRALSSSTDTVNVVGTVGISSGSLNLSPSTDKVSVYGYDGGRYVNSTLYGASGVTIGNSGDALNVNVTNAGISFSVGVGVTTEVVGVTGATPIAVKGRNGEAIEVTSTPGTAVAVTGDFFIDGSQSTKISEIVRPSSIVSGYTLASLTGAPIAVSSPLKTGITVRADSTNTDFIYVGDSGMSGGVTTAGYPLAKTDSIFIECSNANMVWVLGIVGDVRGVNFIGS